MLSCSVPVSFLSFCCVAESVFSCFRVHRVCFLYPLSCVSVFCVLCLCWFSPILSLFLCVDFLRSFLPYAMHPQQSALSFLPYAMHPQHCPFSHMQCILSTVLSPRLISIVASLFNAFSALSPLPYAMHPQHSPLSTVHIIPSRFLIRNAASVAGLSRVMSQTSSNASATQKPRFQPSSTTRLRTNHVPPSLQQMHAQLFPPHGDCRLSLFLRQMQSNLSAVSDEVLPEMHLSRSLVTFSPLHCSTADFGFPRFHSIECGPKLILGNRVP